MSVKQVNPRQYVAQIPQVCYGCECFVCGLLLDIYGVEVVLKYATLSMGVSMQLSNLEVWFQRPKDIVRKLLSGDLDLGIVGLDTVSEYGQVCVEVLGGCW